MNTTQILELAIFGPIVIAHLSLSIWAIVQVVRALQGKDSFITYSPPKS